ncbi:hypothetical protein PGH12_06335 [Chryseobacterium wangxinyae]|uniref:GlsB/YeaQ/YmgE family stress response membrane protein n=1 Tax=Chryseobacterium sp. CY350 TaxID=2997336 RepID=UPI002271F1FC|nr:hypothetical protein [Chryseobacterium sp. CY350]MCY0976767.1 hypothetical protein [Chryseobacterium sp. CY350]WBZ96768.1 hypothetical protein PGH12_06335 [Chryseobacterium sp. CY350]
MEILAWIFVGLIIGIIAKLGTHQPTDDDHNFSVLFGIIGAVAAGVILNITDLYYENLWSFLTIIAPISGAILFLLLYRSYDRHR